MTDASVASVPYVSNFTRQLAPAWLDHVALVGGFAPAARDSGFAWCDLGCGYGLTAAVMAATHPKGLFHGIDANAAHIESANRFASDAGISRLGYHAAGFDEAAEFDLPPFDYIVSQGVYSWVGERARESWRRFIDRHLKPGGILYVSYNAMPGRAADLPLQRLVRALGDSLPGDGPERALAAVRMALAMSEMKVPALAASPLAKRFQERPELPAPGYLVHELMVANWEPMCVNEVRAALAPLGLNPAGSATLLQNYDSFVLKRAERETLGTICDPDVRELARDFFIDQSFRRDVFVRGTPRLSDRERRRGVLDTTWSLARAADAIEYHVKTPAGRLSFDNRAARHIVAALASGPRRLAEIAEGSIPARDLVANALVLSAAGATWPVEANRACVAGVNGAIFKRAAGPEEIRHVVLPFGTAVAASRELLMHLREGRSPPDDAFGSWVAAQLDTCD